MKRSLILSFCLLALGLSGMQAQPLTEKYAKMLTLPPSYTCCRAEGKIKIDGKLNEASWKAARPVSDFVGIRGNSADSLPKTEVKALWDDNYLYVSALFEDDYIMAAMTLRDQLLFLEDAFELFIDPDGDGQDYFEIEANALGTVFDLILNRGYNYGGNSLVSWNCPGLKLSVRHTGALNKPGKAKGWTVEMAVPLRALKFGSEAVTDFPFWRVNFVRVRHAANDGEGQFYVWAPIGRLDMHRPERWGYFFLANVPAGAMAKLPGTGIDEPSYRLIWTLAYAQHDYFKENGRYCKFAHEMGLEAKDFAGIPAGATLKVEYATDDAFLLRLSLGDKAYLLDEKGCFRIK